MMTLSSSEVYSFRKKCFFCNREIIMSNKEGEWHPFEITGAILTSVQGDVVKNLTLMRIRLD
jgi:hypothetical protein